MPSPETTEFDVHCPRCGRANELHSGRPGTSPKDGDVSLCWGCRKPAIYVVGPLGLALREPSDEETQEILAHPEVRQALAAMAESYGPMQATRLWAGGDGHA